MRGWASDSSDLSDSSDIEPSPIRPVRYPGPPLFVFLVAVLHYMVGEYSSVLQDIKTLTFR